MRGTTKSHRLRIIRKRCFLVALVVLAVLVLVLVISAKRGTSQKVKEYALETVSVEFEPLVTPINEQLAEGEQLNTRLIYAVYITLFDNWKYKNNETLKKGIISCFYENTEGHDTVVANSEQIFNRIQEKFAIHINMAKRWEMIAISKNLAIGYIDSSAVLQKNLDEVKGKKTNIGLANFACNALSCKSGYVFGAVGQAINTSFLQRQQSRYDGNGRANLTESEVKSIFTNFGGRPSFDCSGLIKAYSWLNESTGKISRNNPNAMPDCNADGIFNLAKVKGDISEIPDTPGLAVQKNGHVGIYIGGGKVIEARGNSFGVTKTNLKGRGWEHYAQVPNLTYVKSGTYKIHNEQVVISDGKIANSTVCID